MTPDNNLKSFPTIYAAESDYVHKTFADYISAAAENYSKGFEPLQTLPASWYNSLLYLLTEQAQATYALCSSIYEELKSVLIAGDVEPSVAYTNQLLTAIETITKLNIATGSVLGGIKSSADNWKISVDPTTAIASVNTVDATTSAKGIVQLNDNINSDSQTQAATANAVRKAVADAKPGIATTSATGVIKASSSNWGVQVNSTTGEATVKTVAASTSAKGIVQLSDAIDDSTDKAATAKAVKTAVEAVTPGIATTSATGVIKASSSNWGVQVDGTTGVATVKTVDASTSAKGIVQLNDNTNSTSTAQAATANAVKKAFDNGVFRASCSTASSTAAKTVTAPTGFALNTNTLIAVSFTNTNTAANPTLAVGSTGAKSIRYYSSRALAGGDYHAWEAGETVLFSYDGTYWRMLKDNAMRLVGTTLYIEC